MFHPPVQSLKLSIGSFLLVLFAAKIKDEFSPFSSVITLSITLVLHSTTSLSSSLPNPEIIQSKIELLRAKQLFVHKYIQKSVLVLPEIDVPVATRRNEERIHKSINTLLDLKQNILSAFFFSLSVSVFFLFLFSSLCLFYCLMFILNRDRETMADVLRTRLI